MKRAAIYVRVSTEEQRKHGLSVDSQIQALVDYCKEYNFEIVDIYNDAGKSASKKYTTRPALLRLMNDCTSGKIDIILFTKLDRWFRSVKDYHKVQEVLDRANVPWRTIWEDYEIETSAGRFKVNIMLAVAEAEAARTSERIKAVNKFKIENGGFVGSAPTGYKMAKADLVIDPDQKTAVTAFWNKYINTLSIAKAIAAMREHGLFIGHDTAIRMLKNPVYSGETRQGYKCEAYLTNEEWEIVKKSVQDRSVIREAKDSRIYLFSNGLLRCGVCGSKMTASCRTLSGKKYNYYRCCRARNCLCDNNTTISELKIEKYLIANLRHFLDEYSNQYIASVSRPNLPKFAIMELEKKLSRVGERYEDGDISREVYVQKRDAIKIEIAKLQEESKPFRKIEIPADWEVLYTRLDPEHRRAFWYSTVSKIEYFPKETLKVHF